MSPSWAAACSPATGRKFLRGPRGTGLLWVDRSIVERFQPPGIDATSTSWSNASGMHIDAGIRRFEEYEVPYAAYVGLAAAARQALTIGTLAIEQRVVGLGERLRTELAGLPGCDRARHRGTPVRDRDLHGRRRSGRGGGRSRSTMRTW